MFILLIFFVQKILSADLVGCIYSNALQTNFIIEANDETAPEGAVWSGSICLQYWPQKYTRRRESRRQMPWIASHGKVKIHVNALSRPKINDSDPQIWACNRKLFYLLPNQNICCGYSKEPSQWDGSFEHPKHMFKLMGKKIVTILR